MHRFALNPDRLLSANAEIKQIARLSEFSGEGPTRRTMLQAGFALALTTPLAACGFIQAPLLAADSQPKDYPTVAALRFFANNLARLTQSRLMVQVYPAEQLGS